eukprot:301850_1
MYHNKVLYEWTDKQVSGMGNRMGLYWFLCALQLLNNNIIINYFPEHPDQSFFDVIDYLPLQIRNTLSLTNISYINYIKQKLNMYNIKYDFNKYYKSEMTANSFELFNKKKNKFIHPWTNNKYNSFFVFNNQWIIKDIIIPKTQIALKHKYNYNYEFTSCDIALHIRLGDVLQHCGEQHPFYGIKYMINGIHTMHMQCNYNSIQNNTKASIFIVTQLNKNSTHKTWNNDIEKMSKQIANNYLNKLSDDKMIGKYYKLKIVSNDILTDFYLMTSIPHLICLDSSFCLMAMLSNPNKSMFPINDIGILGYLKYLKQWEKIKQYVLSQQHVYYQVQSNMTIHSCQVRKLGWLNSQNVDKLINWINQH